MKIKTNNIQLDTRLQPRNQLNADAILQYKTDMLAGDVFPPVDLMKVNGKYYCISGWHRVLAAQRAGLADIDANVTEGSMDDAMWAACASNVEHDKTGTRRTNADKQKAVKMALQLERYQNGGINYSEIARHVGVDKKTVRNHWEKIHNGGNSPIVKPVTNAKMMRPQDFIKPITPIYFQEQEIAKIQKEIKTEKQAKLNKVNDNIEWAAWSWNPVTGCLHDCDYCYARDIANRFFPEGFQPSYHPERLSAPENTNAPTGQRWAGDIGYKNIFTCSMADLFGKWVPADWIESVIKVSVNNPQWTFLYLTKFPIRMAEFTYPDNVWLGASVDKQHTVKRAEAAFAKIKASGFSGVSWLSCEPMLERLTFTSLDMFDWVVMGGSSKSTQTPEYFPPFEHITHLHNQAMASNCKVYQKTNLFGEGNRIREYPS